jgi:hypothetical protein
MEDVAFVFLAFFGGKFLAGKTKNCMIVVQISESGMTDHGKPGQPRSI